MKQTFLLTLTFFTVLLSPFHSHSQTFRPGFIVQTQGDTLQGLVKYREGGSNLKNCIYKQNQESAAVEYTPQDIAGYGVRKEAVFKSKDITDAKGTPLKAFVEVLVQGRLSLYQHQDLLYLEKEGAGIHPLRLETEEVYDVDKTVARVNTKHLILINSLTYDCPVPEKALLKVQKKLNVPHVIAIVEAYNHCSQPNSSISYKEDKPWIAFEKGVTVGHHITRMDFVAGPHTIKQAEFPTVQNAIAGGYPNIHSPRKSERISLHLEGFYSRENYLGYLELQGPLILYKNDYEVELSRISVLSMARYMVFSHKRFSPYVGAGISSNYILHGQASRRQESETVINNTRQIETVLSEPLIGNKFYVGATAALGTRFSFNEKHKMLLQFRYEKGDFVSEDAILKSELASHMRNNGSFYLTAAYIIK